MSKNNRVKENKYVPLVTPAIALDFDDKDLKSLAAFIAAQVALINTLKQNKVSKNDKTKNTEKKLGKNHR